MFMRTAFFYKLNAHTYKAFFSFVKIFAKVKSKNKTTYFRTIFDRQKNGIFDYRESRNNEIFWPTQLSPLLPQHSKQDNYILIFKSLNQMSIVN